nr:g-type lectin s-receptor-like serine/threonine-protein kinase [Quercus suber]
MKLGWDLVSGLGRYLTSWKSAEDPAPSEISARLDRRELPQLVVMKGNKIKELGTTTQSDECEDYAHCGAYANCDINKSPVCACLKGFIPKSPKDWNLANWSGGCVRGTPLGCNDGDGFLTYKIVKLPDPSSSWFDRNVSLKKCEEMCLENCSCKAYANLDIRNGGSGCLLWFADLIDSAVLQIDGQDLYIRVAASVLGSSVVPGSKEENGTFREGPFWGTI